MCVHITCIEFDLVEPYRLILPQFPGSSHYPSLSEQLGTFTSHLMELLQGLGKAVSSVTSLTVRVTHELYRKGAKVNLNLQAPQPTRPPSSFAEITHTLCKMLAIAAPDLQNLHVQGRFEDAAFDVFGSNCPQLTHLHVDAISFPISMLKEAAKHLKLLTCLTLTYPGRLVDSQPLAEYVGQALQPFPSVCKLVLDFHESIALECHQLNLRHVPGSLRELVCTCQMRFAITAPEIFSNLHTLSLKIESCYPDLIPILVAAPHLKQLSILGQSRLMFDNGMLYMMPALQKRLASGLQLIVPSCRLYGTNAIVNCLLASFPVLPSVLSCTLDSKSQLMRFPLTRINRVFPKLVELQLLTSSLGTGDTGLTIQQLGSLAACKYLKRLKIHAAMNITTAALAELCLSLPCLEVFGCMQNQHVDQPQLQSAVLAQGRVISIERYNSL